MEKNKLATRDQLKTYFETGKRPTENQFSDLIDSLKHKGDPLTNREAVLIANSLESIDAGYVQYSGNGIEDKKFLVAISSDEKEDQVITIRNSPEGYKKLYFLGNPPYTIKAKELPTEGLDEYEYYFITCSMSEYSKVTKLFGGNLPVIPEGFELGTVEDKNLLIGVGKLNLRQKLSVVNTHIKFVNTTGIPVQYMVQAGYWSHVFTDKDMITGHYDIWNFLAFSFRADLRKVERSVECNLYDNDNGNILLTIYLNAGQNNQNVSANDFVREIKNIRIECHYATK